MCQQHAHGHVAAPRIASAKLRHDADHRRIQIEQSTLVENHRHLVVATAFETEARSKTVAVVTAGESGS